ncbi:SWIM zinc finger family protein [Alicyclobacillus acidiphilus]|uniref:SWIM zinc finger family protein n=1 Tax=Alicyclobacillus acidiphilus TaxID=182455 RepID=UPI00082FE424|nr:hypothetical protein [Alicyclobacillus acidiphilus]
MNLSDFLGEVDADILMRGRDYLDEGRIRSLEQDTDGVYHAIVQGSELYRVDVEIDGDGELIKLDCNCPYDLGPVCKHEAAVLLRIAGQRELVDPDGMNMVAAALEPDSSTDLRSLLDAKRKDDLIDLLLSLAETSSLVERQIRFHVSTTDADAEVKECRKFIRDYAKSFADRQGFISYRKASKAMGGANEVVERAKKALEQREYVRALKLSFCVIEEMIHLMASVDDSGGDVGLMIDFALGCVMAVADAVKRSEAGVIDTVFALLVKESRHRKLQGWKSWQLKLIAAAGKLATTPERLRKWEDCVDGVVREAEESAWDRDYVSAEMALIRYNLLLERDGEAEAAAYALANVHIGKMRTLAIRHAIERGKFDEAIQLALDGEQQEGTSGRRSLADAWRELRFEAYRRAGRVDDQRRLGFQLVLGGDFQYYALTKMTYAPSEWASVYESLIQHFEQRGFGFTEAYPQILVEERDWKRLLAYLSQRPSAIERYYMHLVPHHLAEVTEIFLKHIRQLAEQSSNRAEYRGVCRIIQLLHKAGGTEAAKDIVEEMMRTYPRRPAFRDELRSLHLQ